MGKNVVEIARDAGALGGDRAGLLQLAQVPDPRLLVGQLASERGLGADDLADHPWRDAEHEEGEEDVLRRVDDPDDEDGPGGDREPGTGSGPMAWTPVEYE